MASSKSSNTYNRQNWEDSDFPILCQTCLGETPYIRMLKDKHGGACKICDRPFTVFQYCPGPRMRYKRTEICQTCAKLKNVCQTCIFDLEYGLPVQVRDQALKITEQMPKSDVNREYYIQNQERMLAQNGNEPLALMSKQPSGAGADMLTKLARTRPYYERNRPHICSFWVKGECKRGEECPFRHEKPKNPDDPLADQNIKDRYYGVDDPVAEKMQKRYMELPKMTPPNDPSITTLYLGNVDGITETQLRDYFYQFGEIKNMVVVGRQSCAFVEFATRTAAETAADKSQSNLVIAGKRLTIRWGRPSSSSVSQQSSVPRPSSRPNQPVPGLPPLPIPLPSLKRPAQEEAGSNNFFNIGGHDNNPGFKHMAYGGPGGIPLPSAAYPSQDPNRMGTK